MSEVDQWSFSDEDLDASMQAQDWQIIIQQLSDKSALQLNEQQMLALIHSYVQTQQSVLAAQMLAQYEQIQGVSIKSLRAKITIELAQQQSHEVKNTYEQLILSYPKLINLKDCSGYLSILSIEDLYGSSADQPLFFVLCYYASLDKFVQKLTKKLETASIAERVKLWEKWVVRYYAVLPPSYLGLAKAAFQQANMAAQQQYVEELLSFQLNHG